MAHPFQQHRSDRAGASRARAICRADGGSVGDALSSPYGMYGGDAGAEDALFRMGQRNGITDDEKRFGAKAYSQDYEKREESMRRPTGPFSSGASERNRADRADKENNFLTDRRRAYDI